MAKVTLSSILAGFASITKLNSNFQAIQAEFNDKVLYRDNPDGEDNQMENTLDMNSNQIINIPDATLDHEPVAFGQLQLGTSDSQSALDAGAFAADAEQAKIDVEVIHLGLFAVAPTLDNEGNAILEGAQYYNTTDSLTYIRDSSGAWQVFVSVENGWRPIIPLFFSGVPSGSLLMVQFIAPQRFVLPINLTDSYAESATAATAETILTIAKNGSSVGTITFPIAGTTGVFVFSSSVTLDAGDLLTITNQVTADATLADISITLRTNQIVGSVVATYAADFYADSGTANAHVLSAVGLTVSPDAYEEGLRIAYKPNVVNTGAVTVNVDSLGVVNLKDTNGTAFTGGELPAGVFTEGRYDASDGSFYVTTPFTDPATEQWPVGSVFTSTVSTNPAAAIGYGTWTAFGEGRVLIGNGTGNDGTESQAFSGGSTAGKYNHTLLTAEMPAHTHTGDMRVDGNSPGNGAPEEGDNATSGSFTTDSTGGGGAHNNIQPYIVVYMWERTA